MEGERTREAVLCLAERGGVVGDQANSALQAGPEPVVGLIAAETADVVDGASLPGRVNREGRECPCIVFQRRELTCTELIASAQSDLHYATYAVFD